VTVDLLDHQQVDTFIGQLKQDQRHIKYLVNAAGSFKPTRFLEHTKADYDKYLNINKSFFFITQAVAENMKLHGGGAIVNIGSMRKPSPVSTNFTRSGGWAALMMFQL
jgi:short-subunit dehydrogenase